MVKRFHTRQLRYRMDKKGRVRKKRAKSFKSEEQAKTWAAKQGIKNFDLKNSKNPENSQKKITVVVKK